MLAKITDGTITALAPIPASPGWDHDRWWDFTVPAVLSEWMTAYGWVAVTDPGPRPADTDTTRYVQTVTLIAGIPTASWTAVQKSAEMVAFEIADRNRGTLEQRVADQVATILADIAAVRAARERTRAAIGSATDPAGTTSLRAIRAQSNTAVVTAASVKAIVGHVIDMGAADVDTDTALVSLERATVRLSRIAGRLLDSAGDGAE